MQKPALGNRAHREQVRSHPDYKSKFICPCSLTNDENPKSNDDSTHGFQYHEVTPVTPRTDIRRERLVARKAYALKALSLTLCSSCIPTIRHEPGLWRPFGPNTEWYQRVWDSVGWGSQGRGHDKRCWLERHGGNSSAQPFAYPIVHGSNSMFF